MVPTESLKGPQGLKTVPVELSELMQLVAGQKKSLHVGDLPRPVAEHLKCHPAIVFLGHNEVVKIVKKHGEGIKVEQLQCLPFAIKNGEYRDDSKRGDCCTVYYDNPIDNGVYLIGLKRTARGTEVWVQTFFKISATRAKKRREQTALLKVHSRKS